MNKMRYEAMRLRGQIADGRRCPLCGETDMKDGVGKTPRFEAHDCPDCGMHVEKNATPTAVLAHLHPPKSGEWVYSVDMEEDANWEQVVRDFWSDVNQMKREHGYL